jgi:hypothetical protein
MCAGNCRIGEIRRQVKLGSVALYRVLEADPDSELVTVEVIEVPGLSPGRTIRLLRHAVAGMAVVPERRMPKGP